MTTHPHEQGLSENSAYRVLKTVPLKEVPAGSLFRVETAEGAIRFLIARMSHTFVKSGGTIHVYMQAARDGSPTQIPVVYPPGTKADILVESLVEEPAGLGAVVAYHSPTRSSISYYTRAQWSGSGGDHWAMDGIQGPGGFSWRELREGRGYFTLVSPGYDPCKED